MNISKLRNLLKIIRPSLFKVLFIIHNKLKNSNSYSFINFIKAHYDFFKDIDFTIHEGKIIGYPFLPALNSQRAIDILDSNIEGEDKFDGVINYKYKSPHIVHVSITEICPFNCKHCSAGRRKNGKVMNLKDAIHLMKELSRIRVSSISLTGGEPLTHPSIVEIIQNIDNKNINSFLFTTGYSLNKDLAERLKNAGLFGLCISFNSTNEGEMNDFTGFIGSRDIAINALQISKKAGLYTSAQITATKEKISSGEIEKCLKFLKTLNIDEVRILQVLPAGKLIDNDKRKSFLSNDDLDYLKNLQIKTYKNPKIFPKTISMPYFESSEKFGCFAGSQFIYIETTGDVYPCDFIEISYGNIFKDGFEKTYKNIKQVYNKPFESCISRDANQGCIDCKKNKVPKFFRLIQGLK